MMIHLDCPACNTKNELDERFRGGVCRCHNCNTLMTVPADINTVNAPEEEEEIYSPSSRNDYTSPSRRNERDEAPQRRARKKDNSSMVLFGAMGAGVLIVIVLIVIVIKNNRQKPVENTDNTQTNAATIVGTNSDNEATTTPAEEVTTSGWSGRYSPGINPGEVANLNVLGQALSYGNFLVVIDSRLAGNDRERIFSALNKGLALPLQNERLASSNSITIACDNGTDEPNIFGKHTLDELETSELESFLSSSTTSENSEFAIAMASGKSNAGTTAHLILVIGDDLSDDEALSISRLARTDSKITVFFVGCKTSLELRDSLPSGAVIHTLTSSDINNW